MAKPVKRTPSSVKAIPWALMLELAMVARDRWMSLNPHDREELAAIVKKSKGLPQNLTPAERKRLGVLARKLEPAAFVPVVRNLALRRVTRRR